jgi:hypothetical protein
MSEENQSLHSTRGATSFRPSDFSARDLPYLLAALALLTGLAVAIDWLANLLSHELRLFLGGLAAGWLLSACLSAWGKGGCVGHPAEAKAAVESYVDSLKSDRSSN